MRKLRIAPTAPTAKGLAEVSGPTQAQGPAAGVKRRALPRAVLLRAVVAVTASAALATAALATQARAKVPGPNGEILFTRFDPNVGDGVLYTINPDGSGLHPVLPGVGIECPNWSPDGSRIATCGSPDGAASRIIIPAQARSARSFHLTPRSTWPAPCGRPTVAALPATSSPCRTIRAGRASTRSAHPMAAASCVSPRIRAGRTTRWITRPAAPRSPSSAQTRPGPRRRTGRSLSFASTAAGFTRSAPWASRGLGMNAGWSPGGSTIIFSSNGSLYRVSPDGSGLQKIPLHGLLARSFAFDPGWSPNGQEIVFGMVTGTTPATIQEGIYTANADGSDVQQLTQSPTHDDSEDWGAHQLAG